MISHFFIDRPIFASVLSILITLTGGIALLSLPIAQYPPITPPTVQVSINYPGASAQVVADTVAAPIEQQVNGVQGMLYMSSRMGNDGSYTLTVTFDIGTDLNTALVMVQNRVTLAMPLLPTSVQNQGITIKKKTPDILMVVNFFSPDGRYDDIYLSNYATIFVRDELLRVTGVSDINYLGQRDYSIRAWLDPQKLAARDMTGMDVAEAIRGQNLEAAAGQIGQPPAPSGRRTRCRSIRWAGSSIPSSSARSSSRRSRRRRRAGLPSRGPRSGRPEHATPRSAGLLGPWGRRRSTSRIPTWPARRRSGSGTSTARSGSGASATMTSTSPHGASDRAHAPDRGRRRSPDDEHLHLDRGPHPERSHERVPRRRRDGRGRDRGRRRDCRRRGDHGRGRDGLRAPPTDQAGGSGQALHE